MGICALIFIVAALGALGGLVNCAMSDEFKLPGFDKNANIWRPGWVGNILVGAVAAIAVWGIYGPLASFDVINGQPQEMRLTVAQLLSSIIVGLSGGRILSLMAEKQAERVAKESLVQALQRIIPPTK
jgi:hypothetical protein